MGSETLILLIVGAIILYAIYNNLTSGSEEAYDSQADNRRVGRERPRHDDPNIRGRGSFGRPARPRIDRREEAVNHRPSSAPTQRAHNDDNNNVRGRGSFGRDK